MNEHASTIVPLADLHAAQVDINHTGAIREMIRTLLGGLGGEQIVSVVSVTGNTEVLEVGALVPEGAEGALEKIEGRVRDQLEHEDLADFAVAVEHVLWIVSVTPIRDEFEDVVGALVVAGRGEVWDEPENKVASALGELLSLVVTRDAHERSRHYQKRLDDLVARVAERLMGVTEETRQETLDWVMETLGLFVKADVTFMRRNDYAREMSCMVSEWPGRNWQGPEPDPLGDVLFDSDPIFAAMRDLKAPFFSGDDDVQGAYLERARAGSGVTPAWGIAVPLLMGTTTWGILGFLHFETHTWTLAELNTLEAVASMLVHLQGRFDAEHNAHHDELTGLYNRRAIITELERRTQDGRSFAAMILDLDRFKVMNDFLGHASGDELLVAVARRIRAGTRPEDFAGRLGGDEFVVLMPFDTSEVAAMASAKRILDELARPITIGKHALSHTGSIGVALSRPGMSGLDLLGSADVALYAAKAKGRNQAVVFDERLGATNSEESLTELLLMSALDTGDLRLYFQPELDLVSGELVALEALVRWQHPERGLLEAGSFIRIAEETGLITAIDRWVLAEACRQAGAWRDELGHSVTVAVNMSPADFRDEGLTEFVAACLTKNGLRGSDLCIEVTEHIVIAESEKTAAALTRLREMGVEVAIDDFGTGFSSMAELKKLSVDFLKLDMGFVRGITTDRYDAAIVEAIVRLAHALDLTVIAEGVEDEETVKALVDLGCTRGQGYLLGRPAPAEALAEVLAAGYSRSRGDTGSTPNTEA